MVLYFDFLALALIALMPGLVIHSFIIAVNVNDWFRGRSVSPVNQVVTSLGISRMCIQCAYTTYLCVAGFFSKIVYLRVIQVIMNLVYSFFIYYNIWLTSLLSIVFCLKISNLRTRLFLYLRRMIEQRTTYLIVASVLFSAINCLLPFFTAIIEVTKGENDNKTIDDLVMACSFKNSLYTYVVGALIPLLFYFISSVLLFTLLYLHTRRMKMSNNLTINLGTYYSAMQFVSFTFIYNSIYIIGHFVGALCYYFYCVRVLWLHIILGCLPVLHSSYLIYRITKLRSQMSKVLQNVIEFLFQKKDPETREDVKVITQ